MRKEKELLLNEIKDQIEASTAMIITSYSKLEPNASWNLRESLVKQGSILEVVRKRVFLKAAERAGIKLDDSLFKGHIGVVFINQPDAMAPAKTVFKFSEQNGKIFDVICGKIDGNMIPGSEVEVLSKLPTMDEIRATMLGLFVAPMAQMLSVMEAYMAEANTAKDQES